MQPVVEYRRTPRWVKASKARHVDEPKTPEYLALEAFAKKVRADRAASMRRYRAKLKAKKQGKGSARQK